MTHTKLTFIFTEHMSECVYKYVVRNPKCTFKTNGHHHPVGAGVCVYSSVSQPSTDMPKLMDNGARVFYFALSECTQFPIEFSCLLQSTQLWMLCATLLCFTGDCVLRKVHGILTGTSLSVHPFLSGIRISSVLSHACALFGAGRTDTRVC